MSHPPYFFDAILGDYQNPSFTDLHDQHYGCCLGLLNGELLNSGPLMSMPLRSGYCLGLLNDELLNSGPLMSMPLRSGYLRPWRSPLEVAAAESGIPTYPTKKNEFRINLDVQQFKPHELKVSVTDGYIVVEGKHDERSDEHGFVARQFTRRYKIPEDVDGTKLSSYLFSDGVLGISAPKIVKKAAQGWEIPIVQTKQPAMKQSSSSK